MPKPDAQPLKDTYDMRVCQIVNDLTDSVTKLNDKELTELYNAHLPDFALAVRCAIRTNPHIWPATVVCIIEVYDLPEPILPEKPTPKDVHNWHDATVAYKARRLVVNKLIELVE